MISASSVRPLHAQSIAYMICYVVPLHYMIYVTLLLVLYRHTIVFQSLLTGPAFERCIFEI